MSCRSSWLVQFLLNIFNNCAPLLTRREWNKEFLTTSGERMSRSTNMSCHLPAQVLELTLDTDDTGSQSSRHSKKRRFQMEKCSSTPGSWRPMFSGEIARALCAAVPGAQDPI